MRYCKIIFIILFILIFQQFTYADPPLPTPVGRVVWVKGALNALMPNKEVRSLQKTSVIYLHDTLVTDAKSQAEIVFTDNTLMTFREGTRFYIDQYAFHPQGKQKSVGKYVMNLIEGGFRTVTGLIAKANPSDYQVNTPVATIGVRGTDYAVYFRNGQVYVGYYSGSPCIRSKNGTSLCLSATVPYGTVSSATASPVPLAQQPDVFRQQLPITNTTIQPFTAAPGTVTGGGTVTSFCIQ